MQNVLLGSLWMYSSRVKFPISVLFKTGQGLRGGTSMAPVSLRDNQAPSSGPSCPREANGCSSPGTCTAGCSCAPCHLRALWEISEEFSSVWVSISTCLCIFSLMALWARDQGAARPALPTAMSLWQRLPPHQPNWQKETHGWLELQHLKPKHSLSA